MRAPVPYPTADCGVRLPAATLLGHAADFLTWFEPLDAAIAAHRQEALFVQGDETSWVVHVWGEVAPGQALGRRMR